MTQNVSIVHNNTSISEGIYPPFQIQLFAPFSNLEKEKKTIKFVTLQRRFHQI